MSDSTRETDARINIDEFLRQAGWNPTDKSQVETEVTISLPDGKRVRTDYVLRDQRGRALAIIEAKKQAIDPYIAK